MHGRTLAALTVAALLLGGETARADEQVVVTARFFPAPGREAELEARLLRSVEFVKRVEPTITYRLHRSVKEPTVFFYYEIYPSQAAFDRHRTETIAAFRREAGPPPDGIFARAPEGESFRILAE
jgi:quinol monooxygenase YgiN